MHKQRERESLIWPLHRERTKTTTVEGINPKLPKKIELRMLAAIDSCFHPVGESGRYLPPLRWIIANSRIFPSFSTLVPEAFFYSFLANFGTRTASFIFYWHEALRAEKLEKKALVNTVKRWALTFMPSAFDRRFWLEDIALRSRMIGWIKYLWGCNWSKENDIFDSCQVLSQHESGILNDLDLAFFSLGSAPWSALRVAKFQIKKIKQASLWDQDTILDGEYSVTLRV